MELSWGWYLGIIWVVVGHLGLIKGILLLVDKEQARYYNEEKVQVL